MCFYTEIIKEASITLIRFLDFEIYLYNPENNIKSIDL